MGPNVTLKELGTDNTLWVGNSGASRRMGKSSKGLVSTCALTRADTFILGNGSHGQAATVGDLMGYAGATKIKVRDVSYCPQAKFNLFSLSAMLNKGWLLEGNKDELILRNSSDPRKILKFNVKVKTANGVLFCVGIQPIEVKEMAGLSAENELKSEKWTKITNIQRWHEELVHMGEQTCRLIAKHANVELTRKAMETCEACAVAKARQKNLGRHYKKRENCQV